MSELLPEEKSKDIVEPAQLEPSGVPLETISLNAMRRHHTAIKRAKSQEWNAFKLKGRPPRLADAVIRHAESPRLMITRTSGLVSVPAWRSGAPPRPQ